MKLIKSESGYSLLEMIITIALIAIAISTTTFGLSVIFSNNVNSYANEMANQFRLVQTREMAKSKNDYLITIKYDSGDSRYEIITSASFDGGPWKDIHTIKLPKVYTIKKDGSVLGTSDTQYLIFNPSSGAIEVAAPPIVPAGAVNAAGTYTLSSTSSDLTRDIVVLRINGRVYVNE